jgi:hypothetical protein
MYIEYAEMNLVVIGPIIRSKPFFNRKLLKLKLK